MIHIHTDRSTVVSGRYRPSTSRLSFTRLSQVCILLSFLLLMIHLQLTAQSFFENRQPPRFGLIDRSHGLGSLSISAIQQDKYGFLWFGSQGGLYRFDGRKIQSFTHNPYNANSIPNDLIQTLYYDQSDNALWIGTYGGLACLEIDSGHFTHYKKKRKPVGAHHQTTGLSNNIIIAISQDRVGNIWVGTMEGLNRISIKGKQIDLIPTVHPTIRSLHLDSSGRLWIGSYGGLQYWDQRSHQAVKANIQLPSTNVMSITEPEPGRLLLGLWGSGIAEFWPDLDRIRAISLPDKRIYAVMESQDGTIWAGSWGGGLWARPKKGDPVLFNSTQNSELSNAIIYSLFEDKGGLLWVGTNGGGVHYLSPRRNNYRMIAHHPNIPNSLATGKIQTIHRRQDGKFYIGVYGGGLNIYNPETKRVTIHQHNPRHRGSISDNNINCIIEDRNRYIWIATSNGLNRFYPERDHFESWESIHPKIPLSHSIISFLLEDRKGRLWIGTYGYGIDRYDPASNQIVHFDHDATRNDSLSDGNIYYILEKSDGSVWISTNDGLNRFNPADESFTRYLHQKKNPFSISGNNTRSLFEDSRGRLWIGTYSAGINQYNAYQDRFHRYSKQNGLSSNNVLAIQEGVDRRIWISTREGINVIDPKTKRIEVIDERDGLFGSFFNQGNFKDKDGTLYFGGSHGITRIRSIKQYRNHHQPDVHITRISVMGIPLKKSQAIFNNSRHQFPHDKNFISFEFVGLDYESPVHNRYRYKLRGFDQDWIDSGTRSFVRYTNLPPGKYTFQVKASNNDGLWNQEGASVHLQILMPLYRQWWAYGLYLLVLIAAIWLFLKIRESRLMNLKNMELEKSNQLLENANRELEKLTVHDDLTGIYNRRYFDSQLLEELIRAQRAVYPLSILMIDVDHFKKFNDQYGHIAGDQALKRLAKVLKASTPRYTDFITRYGGEEFAIVLFNTDLAGAQNVAESIHQRLKKNPIIIENREILLTVSIGIWSEIPKVPIDPETFIHKADQALYRAKSSGRNRTEI